MSRRVLICRINGPIHHDLLALGWQEHSFACGFVKLIEP
jgi:hypothetical protein